MGRILRRQLVINDGGGQVFPDDDSPAAVGRKRTLSPAKRKGTARHSPLDDDVETDADEAIDDEDDYIGQGDRDAVTREDMEEVANSMREDLTLNGLIVTYDDRLRLPGTMGAVINARRAEVDFDDGLTLNSGDDDMLPLPDITGAVVNARRREVAEKERVKRNRVVHTVEELMKPPPMY
jgi:hypothetical protein